NDNYIVGDNGEIHRNFFLFDLASLDLTAELVVSATLELEVVGVNPGFDQDRFVFEYGLFDISLAATPASVLVAEHDPGDAEGLSIFADLGSGTAYGSLTVDSDLVDADDLLVFTLNAAALGDITAAAGGFFGIGGSITNLDEALDEPTLHGGSGGAGIEPPLERDPHVQRLTIETVPEPGTLPWLAPALGAWLLWSRGGARPPVSATSRARAPAPRPSRPAHS
ncbi:MAG TPA: hypothetical protein VLC53_01315, partial [Myxococcota bacterium]|nr:hypothetical protein [Myxococcota bacterium]